MAEIKEKEFLVLECSTEGIKEREFEVSHAEKLLSMPKNGGWKLPANSNYQYSEKTGLTKKAKQANS